MYENVSSHVSHDGSKVSTGLDYRSIVRALDQVYEGASNVAMLVEDGKLTRDDVLVRGLERWLVAHSLARAGEAAATLVGVASELPDELMIEDLARSRDLLVASGDDADDIDWGEVADVALHILPKVRTFSRALFWERWVPILGEGAPRLPFALHA